jgi:hypothetical protein
LPIAGNNVAEIVVRAWAGWKIENEGFIVMKNHGQELEHRFGPVVLAQGSERLEGLATFKFPPNLLQMPKITRNPKTAIL